MWFVTGRIRGDGDSLRQQSPEFLLVNLSILTASFNKHCCLQWPSDIRSMRVGCSCGSEAPLVLVSSYLEMLDSDLKVSCLLLIQQAPTQRFNYRTQPRDSIIVQWINDPWWNLLQGLLACNDRSLCCWFFRESPAPLKRLILTTYTTKVILP
jgi:hypothetical protein